MLQIRILPSYTFRASSQNIGPSWLAVLVQREMPASDRQSFVVAMWTVIGRSRGVLAELQQSRSDTAQP